MGKLIAVLAVLLAVYTGYHGYGGLAFVLLCVAGFAALVGGGSSSSGSLAGGRMIAVKGHAHGDDLTEVAEHELGHKYAGEAVGGKITSVRVYRNGGGYTRVTLPDHDPERAITFWLGGQKAVGTQRGASYDNGLIRKELRKVPASERAALRRRAERAAEKAVAAKRSKIASQAPRLAERGKL